MKIASRLLGFGSVAILLTACSATVGVGGGVSVPSDAPVTCGEYCSKMGMTLGAVVVMANNVGCVCSPSAHAASNEQTAAPVAGGVSAILIQEQQRRQQMQRSVR